MKLQKSGLLLAIFLLSVGAEILGSVSGSKTSSWNKRLNMPPAWVGKDVSSHRNLVTDTNSYTPPKDLANRRFLVDWVIKNAREIVEDLGSSLNFDQIERYSNDNNLHIPQNLTDEEKAYIVEAVNSKFGVPVAIGAFPSAWTKIYAGRVARNLGSDVTFEKIKKYVTDENLDSRRFNNYKFTNADKNFILAAVKAFEGVEVVEHSERAQNSEHVFKIVEVVQDLAQQAAQNKEEKYRAEKKQLSNVLDVVGMLKDMEREEQKARDRKERDLEDSRKAAMQQQLDRTLEVVKFVSSADHGGTQKVVKKYKEAEALKKAQEKIESDKTKELQQKREILEADLKALEEKLNKSMSNFERAASEADRTKLENEIAKIVNQEKVRADRAARKSSSYDSLDVEGGLALLDNFEENVKQAEEVKEKLEALVDEQEESTTGADKAALDAEIENLAEDLQEKLKALVSQEEDARLLLQRNQGVSRLKTGKDKEQAEARIAQEKARLDEEAAKVKSMINVLNGFGF